AGPADDIMTFQPRVVDQVHVRSLPDFAIVQIIAVRSVVVPPHLQIGPGSQRAPPTQHNALSGEVAIVGNVEEGGRRIAAYAQIAPRDHLVSGGRNIHGVIGGWLPIQAESRLNATPVVKIFAVGMKLWTARKALRGQSVAQGVGACAITAS